MSGGRTLHLAAAGPIPERLRSGLDLCGIRVSRWEEVAERKTLQGVLVTRVTDVEKWDSIRWTASRLPRLFLVYGPEIPDGWTDRRATRQAGKGDWDVVRMMLLDDGERALIGGAADSISVQLLRRHLAGRQIVTLVCATREVDEVYRQLPRYLTMKEKFFLELGDRCDELGISLQVVARALGMDKRVGQGWLFPERPDSRHLCRWIYRETRALVKNPNVQRVALWGPASFWEQMPAGWLGFREIRMYAHQAKSFPNERLGPDSPSRTAWTDALEQADLLVIGEADELIREVALEQLGLCMRQSMVVDAAACFPLQEAKAYLKFYRSIGEKTNV